VFRVRIMYLMTEIVIRVRVMVGVTVRAKVSS